MFYLLWLVFFLFCLIFYGIKKRSKILARFASKKAYDSIFPYYSEKRIWIKSIFLIISLILIVICLCEPFYGFRWEKVEQKGVDIMICLDTSKSMLASDIKPNRLERAKHEIIDLLKMMRSDRAGLVAFAGRAILQCPLTLDYNAFNIFLKALNPEYLPIGGTDIGGAIEIALNSFEKKIESEKAIILITDGENTSGKPFKIAEKAREKGVKIFCVGIGKEQGAPIPDADKGFKKDKNGTIILSKVDEKTLKKIAAITNGIYVRSVAGDIDLNLIYFDEIQKNMDKNILKTNKKKVLENRFQWFLFPAIILMLIELFIGKSKNIGKSKKKTFFIIFVFCFFVFSNFNICYGGVSKSVKKGIKAFLEEQYKDAEKYFIDAQLQRPDKMELYYNIGSAVYKNGDYESALQNFAKALKTDDKELKNKIRYNLGNTKYRLGKLEDAIKEYEKVLKENPNDIKAKENIEFVKKKLEQQKQKSKDNKNKNDKNKDDKKDQDKENNNQDKQDQNKENQEGKDQDKQDKNKQDKNQENQDKENKNKSDKNENNKNKEQNQEKENQNKKENLENGKNQNSENKNIQKKDAKDLKNTLSKQANERMLNRLEDKPGRALLFKYEKKNVEKDW